MQGTVDGFSYGLVTPLVAFLMACLGGALGLCCTTRSMTAPRPWRPVWLALGSVAIGSGIWTMHFIGMMGFAIEGTPIHYDRALTFASLAVGIVMVGTGIFIVGYRGHSGTALFTGGTVTGLGIASMHYLGMAGMSLDGRLEYDTVVVAVSVAIAMAAASAALWAAGQVRGFLWSVGASLVMGLAVTGMHYTGMAALDVHVHGSAVPAGGESAAALLGPLMVGPLAFLVLAGVVVAVDPLMISGRPPGPRAEHRPGVPAHSTARRPSRSRLRHRGPVEHRSRTPQRH
ncbi:MHYT domain-containing protein [Streptomyces griseoflavus]|uniref:MHYT domain-containing protein n=1 Tax=Streptomyces griseoflavus TaxID=35619 RepID=UPI00382614C6